VEICPTEAFHEGSNFVVINPDECIDCGLCVPECPVNAIFSDKELPASQIDFLQINYEYSRHWPILTEKKAALSDAEFWAGKTDKRQFLKIHLA
jgi:ferredoxin